MEVYEKGIYLIIEQSLLKKYKQAIRYCDMMARHSADTDELAVCHAYNLSHTEGVLAAIAYLEKRMDRQQQPCLLGLLSLASLYTQKQQYKRALTYYQSMWELFDVADEATLFNIGYCHQMLQDYNNASMFYGRCLSINPNSLCALINMRSLEMLRDCYEIDKPLNIRENSGDNQTSRHLNQSKLFQFLFGLGSKDLQVGSKQINENVNVNKKLLAKVAKVNSLVKLAKEGNPIEAIRELKKLVEGVLKPQNLLTIINVNLAILYTQTTQFRLALQHFKTAVELCSFSPPYQRLLRGQIKKLRAKALLQPTGIGKSPQKDSHK